MKIKRTKFTGKSARIILIAETADDVNDINNIEIDMRALYEGKCSVCGTDHILGIGKSVKKKQPCYPPPQQKIKMVNHSLHTERQPNRQPKRQGR